MRPKRAKRNNDTEALPDPVYMSPVIEWWIENFSLVSDIVTRRYPFYMVAYDSVLADPDKTVRDVFQWLGDGDVEEAIEHVEPALRTQDEDPDDDTTLDDVDLEPGLIEVFDALYEVVRTQEPLQQSFVDRLNETNEKLSSRIETAMKETARAQLERKRLIQARRQGKNEGAEGPAEG